MMATVVVLWVVPAASSLWLDETGSYWITNGSFTDSITRAFKYSGQSPLYYALLWFARRIFGTSELGLRAPSLIAAAAAAYVVYRLARRLFGLESGLVAAAAFAASTSAAFAAADVRPYALGLFLFAASTLALVRWSDDGGARFMWGYVLLASLTVYSNYVFGLSLLSHVVYVLLRRRTSVVPWHRLAVPATAMGLLLIPVAMDLLGMFSTSRILTTVRTAPSFGDLLYAIVPGAGVIGLLAGAAVARITRRSSGAPRPAPSSRILSASMLLIPPVSLFILARTASPKFFYARYFVTASIGAALLLAYGIMRLGSTAAKRAAVFTLVALSLITYARFEHTPEDWRGAARAVRALALESDAPVLVRTAFTGTIGTEWLSRPEQRSFDLAPLLVYPMAGHVIPVSFGLDEASRRYLAKLVSVTLTKHKDVVFVTRAPHAGVQTWLTGRLAAEDYISRNVFESGVRVFLFERRH